VSERYNGGPAFPVPLNQGQSWQGMAPCDGMTLRDYFAAKALTGLLGVCMEDDHPGVSYVDHVSRLAYESADAMLKARQS
jgi:hypothetical protein